MLLKKIALIGSALGLLTLPVIASADLNTYNWTDKPSTVKITSGALKPCSATFGKITPAFDKSTNKPGFSGTSVMSVKAICGQFKGTCSADIYASNNCTGDKIASVEIDVDSLTAGFKAGSSIDPHYTITIAKVGGNTEVNIKPHA